jgi:tetratricopeptide (TPR) repeat protein
MVDHSRLEDLRRRVQKDPASIAFAQLAEECRRSGEFQESIDICRAGLAIHPGYLSARVTLGRALVELGQLSEAQAELSRVLASAPENLAAIRGLAEIHHRRGELAEALAQYRAALLLARNDPDLEETIADLSRQVEPAKPAPSGGLTLEHMQDELLKLAPPPKKGDGSHFPPAAVGPESAKTGQHGGQVSEEKTSVAFSAPTAEKTPVLISAEPPTPPVDGTLTAAANDRATRTVAALEQWLTAIHVSREQRNP